MSRLADLVIGGDPRALQLLAVCDLSSEKTASTGNYGNLASSVKNTYCNIPYKDVIATKMKQLLNEV